MQCRKRPSCCLQMHEMLTYLNQQGVLTLVILAQSGVIVHMQSPST